MRGFVSQTSERLAKSTLQVVAQKIGEPVEKDDYGHINVLIAGYAGDSYRGWLLTDTLMLASYNPTLWTVTFLSIPRDLYVVFGRGATGRINTVYQSMAIDWWNSHEAGINALMEKVSQITGVPVNYYAMVDFDWFVDFVDSLWGVTVDVQEDLYDNQYPGPNDSYTVFQVTKWVQTFDGETALKYARSRKTTSDFSRSFRQQQIISAMIDAVKSSVWLTNLGALRDLYEEGMTVFKTNLSVENMLWLAQFGEKKPTFFSFVYEPCDKWSYQTTVPACVLWYGSQAVYGGSVIIPEGAVPNNLSYYKHTEDAAYRLVYRQDILLEDAPITIHNGIDTKAARAQWYRVSGVASELAVELVVRGFDVVDVDNALTGQELTTIYVSDLVHYKETVDALAAFADYKDIIETTQYGTGITLIIGNDWLKKL